MLICKTDQPLQLQASVHLNFFSTKNELVLSVKCMTNAKIVWARTNQARYWKINHIKYNLVLHLNDEHQSFPCRYIWKVNCSRYCKSTGQFWFPLNGLTVPIFHDLFLTGNHKSPSIILRILAVMNVAAAFWVSKMYSGVARSCQMFERVSFCFYLRDSKVC